MKKVAISILIGVLLIIILFYINGFRLSSDSAIRSYHNLGIKKAEIISTNQISSFKSIIVFSNENKQEYGKATLYNFFNIAYRAESIGTDSLPAKDADVPFFASSIIQDNKYIVFVKALDDNIKYISVGSENPNSPESYYYNLKLDQIEKNPSFYVKEANNGTCAFTGTVKNIQDFIPKNIILGFNKQKKLIAVRTSEQYGNFVNNFNN